MDKLIQILKLLETETDYHAGLALKETAKVYFNQIIEGQNQQSKLTRQEIEDGQNNGRVYCIRMVRDRLRLSLAETAHLVDSEFKRLGYMFKTS